jgi:ribA/ribD-fused uncharacterized protein
MTIETFQKENRYLSNMWRLEHWLNTPCGIIVPTSEHYYQSVKFRDPDTQKAVAMTDNGIEAKKLAEHLENAGEVLIDEWKIVKLGVMRVAVWNKFLQNPELRKRLLDTGDEELVEGNNWGDRFWGVDPPGSDNGKNHLGKIIMGVRHDFVSHPDDYPMDGEL